MKQTTHFHKVGLCLAVLLILQAQPTPACGPFALEAVFTFVVHPEFPLERFAHGEIGVVQPTFARSYLFAAYRNLSGKPFSDEEQKQLLALWQERLDYTWPEFDESWPKPWLAARQNVPGVGSAPSISTSRHREKPNEYETYVNCQKDAFETAANTLELRIRKFGGDSPIIKDWIAAQDTVFANCGEGTHIPAPAQENADALIRADRSYQIAAANFYSGNFDEANRTFQSISHDDSSPWRQPASYLSARTMLRKASLGPTEARQASLSESEAILQNVLNDKNLKAVQPAASRLMSLVRLRLHPEMRVRELAQTLLKRDDENLKQDLWDYTVLLDDLLPSEDSAQKITAPADLRKDDLTDWIMTLQAGDQPSLNHALERWQATASVPWLVTVMTKMAPGHPQVAAALDAARKVSSTSPGFPSVMFHRFRLEAAAGKKSQARAGLDDFLAKHKSSMPASAVNLFLGLRMLMANNLSELLAYAQRSPAGYSWDEDGRELPADLSEDSDLNQTTNKSLLDLDGARVLNEELPLSVLQQAAYANALPAHLQRDLVQSTWLRAVLLDDHKRAREISPAVKSLIPGIDKFVDDYLAAPTTDEMRFAGIYTWLKFPGLQPVVTAGVIRRAALAEQDVYRDNWWCSGTISSASAEDGASSEQGDRPAAAVTASSDTSSSPLFLNPVQKAAAKAEYTRLRALGSAPNYLCKQAMAWVQKHPTDPRGPEALHLAVRTTRYGCTDKETARWSKAAYDLLHKRFPNNPWTKKTPYWFKD